METRKQAEASVMLMDQGLNKKLLRLTGMLFVSALLANTQTLTPGEELPGPPARPGQLGPAPKKPANSGQANPEVSKPQTIGDVIGASDEKPDIRVTTNNVLVPTTVLDPDGHGYVNGIIPSEFELFDNDKPQKISAEFTQLPMSVVLVVQANSEIEPVLSKLKKSGILLQGLVTGEGGDVAILAFDHRMQLLQDFTDDPEKIDDAMQKLTAGSSSARLIDAVDDASRMLKRHDPANARRHVILVLSRNLDKGSEAHLQETVRKMQFENVIIYCVDISKTLTAFMKKPDLPRPQDGGIPPSALPKIAGGTGPYTGTSVVQEQTGNWLNAVPLVYHNIRDLFKRTPAEAFAYFTGGQVYSFATTRAMEDAITDIGKDLNSQYLLSYSPAKGTREEPGFHNIRVLVNRPGLRIRTRPGYWWGGGQQ